MKNFIYQGVLDFFRGSVGEKLTLSLKLTFLLKLDWRIVICLSIPLLPLGCVNITSIYRKSFRPSTISFYFLVLFIERVHILAREKELILNPVTVFVAPLLCVIMYPPLSTLMGFVKVFR